MVKQLKKLRLIIVIIVFPIILNFGIKQFLRFVNAFEMNSGGYRIQMGNLNIGGEEKITSTESGYNLAHTLGQTAALEFSSTGYIIKAGFQYWHSIVPFFFSLSNTNVDFGELFPNNPKTDSIDITVSFGGGGQYQVTAAEDKPLTSLDELTQIADTCCDPGCGSPSKCDQNSAALWALNTTTGFGYKMSGEDIPTTFISCGSDCYRRFANLNNSEQPVIIMSNNNVTVDLSSKPKDIYHQSTITFKVNTDSNQPSGTYQTIIRFIATPSY